MIETALNIIEVILIGLLLGVFLVAYSHFRKASFKLEFVMVAIACVTLIGLTKLFVWLISFVIGVVM